MTLTSRKALTVLAALAVGAAFAQQDAPPGANDLQVHGNFNIDGQLYNPDEEIGAVPPPEDWGLNAWGNLIITRGAFEAGLRLESYTPPLLGYPAGEPYTGSGLGYRYVRYAQDDLDITVGSFFEQFGSGLAFRSYEERYLGVDNAMDGVRVKFKPTNGVYLKGFIGEQRLGFNSGFTKGPGVVRGVDLELSLNELLDSLAVKGRNLIIGGSFVSKYQEDRDPLLELPENVGLWAARLNYLSPHWNLYTEYAYKINDPNSSNNTIFKDGEALMFNATYVSKGLGISAGIHSYDNMVFRSNRAAGPFDLNINFLPPLAKQHTYNLPATLYPYATQPNNEVAGQAEIFYKWKKGTALGGKYGTKLAINGSVAYALDTVRIVDDTVTYDGYTSSLFGMGDRMYFSDINVELRKKVSSTWEFALTYLNLGFDIETVQGKPGKPLIYADMVILEGMHKLSDANTLRFELQHLSTKQDHGNWATALVELTFSPHWSLTVMDQYNYGGAVETEEIHYPLGSVAYTRGASRVQVNYGRQRAGIFCVGGVCRAVPAANGLTVSIASTF